MEIPFPCKFDHNGECLICDCWPSNCAWERFLNKDFKYESLQELTEMFKEQMKDRLLGSPPDQILESEKLRRLQDISDRQLAITKLPRKTETEITDWLEKLKASYQEEQELDRRYPDLPPEE